VIVIKVHSDSGQTSCTRVQETTIAEDVDVHLISASWHDRYVQRHMHMAQELRRYGQAFGVQPAVRSASGYFKLWGEPPSLRIDMQTWSALLQTLHAECAGLEDLQRWVARSAACPGGFLVALQYLRQRLALVKGPSQLIDERSFRDLQARVPGECKCTTTVCSHHLRHCSVSSSTAQAVSDTAWQCCAEQMRCSPVTKDECLRCHEKIDLVCRASVYSSAAHE
jgi:hypothetical protein